MDQSYEEYMEQEDGHGNAKMNTDPFYINYPVFSSDASCRKATSTYCISPSNTITTSTQSSDHLAVASPSYQAETNENLPCDNLAPFNQQHAQQDIREDSQNFKQKGCRNMPLTLPVSPPLRDSIKTKSYQVLPSSQELDQYTQETLREGSESPQNDMKPTGHKFHMKNKLLLFLNFLILTVLYGLGSKQGKLYKKKGTEAFSRAQEMILSLLQRVFCHERAPQLKEYLETVQNKLLKGEKNRAIKSIALALAGDLDFGLLVCCWLEEIFLSKFFLSVMIFSCWIEGCRMSEENKAGLKCRKQLVGDEVAEIRSYLTACSHQLDLVQGDGGKAEFLKRIRSETKNFTRLTNFMREREVIFRKIAKELEKEKNKKIKVNL